MDRAVASIAVEPVGSAMSSPPKLATESTSTKKVDLPGPPHQDAAAAHPPTPLTRSDSGIDTSTPPPVLPDGVRVLGLHEWKAAARCLAEAFAEDHSSMYFVDTPDRAHWSAEQKWDLHVKIMEYITYAHLLKGLVVSAGGEGEYDCVGLWMPPGQNIDSPLTLLRSGLWRLNYQLSPEGRNRFFTEFMPLLTTTKLQVLGPSHDLTAWYLVYIGTRPAGRGKGYARKVIEYVTRQADREGRLCYLESSHAVNRIIYGKLGFEVRKSIYLQRTDENVELDIMVREPKGKE